MNYQPTQEYLSGTGERITYHNPENSFCVLRIKVPKHKDLITITGHIPSISAGEHIKCFGTWHNDQKHGKQFKADFLKPLPPDTIEGIEKYLGSGLIKGIGPYFAKKLVATFKKDIFEIIEHKSTLLSTVEGIGKTRAQNISNSWYSQKVIREIMIFLQSHGVSTSKATRIYKTYGEKAIQKVSENPWQLARDITNIGFISADVIATNLGIAKDSLERIKAGITHMLLKATYEGHCYLPREALIRNSQELLAIEQGLIELALTEEIKMKSLSVDTIENVPAVFLTSYYIYEKTIAQILSHLVKLPVLWDKTDISESIPIMENLLGIKLAQNQKFAISLALQNRVMVITGGPGTGKTTLINTLLRILKEKGASIKLCAPTGRAAKRLSESTGIEATTIHRLLEFEPARRDFKHNEKFPLKCDYLVVDEASMVDVFLFYSLLKALPSNSALLLVGDVDQLPSVGAGQILRDIIDSKVIPYIRLTEIFRQATTSDIIKNAHLINNGILPDLRTSKNESDFYFVGTENNDDIVSKIITMVRERIPEKFGLDPIRDIQILCPMQRGFIGVKSLNTELQKTLNPDYIKGISRFGQIFAVGDKVMQTENNYTREIYNGDIGTVTSINEPEQEVTINFYNREVIYDYSDLDQLTLAYATTIHKSQGSEYPAVIIPLTMQSYLMLKRNLLYTAITRGKKLVVVIGQKKAFFIAVKNNTNSQRYSKLKDWLLKKGNKDQELMAMEGKKGVY